MLLVVGTILAYNIKIQIMNDQREKSVPRLYGYVTQGLRTDQPRRNLDTRPLNTLK